MKGTGVTKKSLKVYKFPMEHVVEGDCTTYVNTSNMCRTTSLFWELNLIETYEPVYTLARKDKGKYKSMQRMFLEDDDPTGYTTCMRTVGNFDYWRRIWASGKLKPHMDTWIEELEAKMTAQAIKTMQGMDNPTAAKWLADRGWAPKRGRPTKAEKAKALKEHERVKDMLEDDAARIMIN